MSDLTPERIAELKCIAEAATQGEWTAYPLESIGMFETFIPSHVRLTDLDEQSRRRHRFIADCGGANLDNDANAAHIAAFDPPTVLALLAALTAERERAEKAERERDGWQKQEEEQMHHILYEMESGERPSLRRELSEALSERDALRAQVERLREAMGEEWPLGDISRPDDYWRHCPECRQWKPNGHPGGCGRGRFFAALAGSEGKP